MFRLRYNCIVILLFLLLSKNDSDCLNSPKFNEEVLNRLLKALEKAYDFYESEYQDVNLDGIYGLRVSEGALIKILHEQRAGKLNIKKSLLTRITLLERKASRAADKSLPQLKRSNPLYYKKFETTILKPWQNFKTFKKLDYSMYIPVSKRSEVSFDEDSSDRCMTQMTGTGEQHKKPCQLSDQCWSLMTGKGADGYALTHQALFLLIGEVQGCKKVLEEKLKSSESKMNLQKLYARICASMYPQMVEFEKRNRKSNYDRDLYMEQAMVCGSMGYSEFLSLKRLEKILNWQMKSGCFGSLKVDDHKQTSLYNDEQAKKIFKKNGFDERMYDDLQGYDFKPGANARKLTSMRTMRSLLVEKELNGGCLSHITGVATGLLGVYLRWVVHQMYPPSVVAKQSSQDEPQQLPDHHHMFMRKMMQNQPLSAKNIHQERQSLNMTKYFIIILSAMMLLVIGRRLILRNIFRPIVVLVGKTNMLGIWEKVSAQKRNV